MGAGKLSDSITELRAQAGAFLTTHMAALGDGPADDGGRRHLPVPMPLAYAFQTPYLGILGGTCIARLQSALT